MSVSCFMNEIEIPDQIEITVFEEIFACVYFLLCLIFYLKINNSTAYLTLYKMIPKHKLKTQQI